MVIVSPAAKECMCWYVWVNILTLSSSRVLYNRKTKTHKSQKIIICFYVLIYIYVFTGLFCKDYALLLSVNTV